MDELSVAQAGALVVAGALAALVLTAWFLPSLARYLPPYWEYMKANTAVVALAITVSLALSWPRLGERAYQASQIIAALVGVGTTAVLLEYVFRFSTRMELLLPSDARLALPGRMAPQTALCFALLSIAVFLLRRRKTVPAVLADITISMLCVIVLANASGEIYGATRMFGLSNNNRTGPTTLICLSLLTFVAFGRRAEYGMFGIMLGTGIGSRISRVAFPVAFVLPFVLEAARDTAIRTKLLTSAYATAISTTLAVLLAFALILLLAWRIDSLEKEVVELSLRDELTQLYNRRGFYMLAEQALWLAQRSRKPFSVLFLDLDNLKQINDSQGHEEGSQFLYETAELLRQLVRKSDVVGRVGGDEFVVAGESSEEDISLVVERLNQAAAEINAQSKRKHPFAFSVGCATMGENETGSLQDLLHRADVAMYAVKRKKKLARGQYAPATRSSFVESLSK